MQSAIKPVKSTIMVSLITAVCLLGDSMLYIVLPLYWEAFGLDNLWQVGILLSVNRLIRLPFNPIAVWVYSKIGQRTGVLIAVFLAVLTTAGYSFLSGFWLLLLARCIWGIAWNFLRLGAYFSILQIAPHSQLGYHMGIYNGVFRLGSLFGMLGGAIIAEFTNPLVAGYIFAVCSIFALPLALLYVPKATFKEDKKDEQTTVPTTYNSSAKKVLVNSFCTALVYQGIFVSMLSYLTGHNNIKVEFLTALGLGAASVAGILQAIRWSWEPYLAPKIGAISDGDIGRQKMLLISCAVAGALFMVVSFNMPIWLWIVIVLLIQLFGTAITTLSDAAASDIAIKQPSKTKFMGAHSFSIDLGSAVGPIVGYTLNSTLGINSVFLVAGIALLTMAVIWSSFTKKTTA